MASIVIRSSILGGLGDSKDGSSDIDRVNALRSLFYIARDQKRPRYQNWVRNYKILTNRLQGGNTTSWLPQPRDSEIYPLISSLVAWMTDQDPDIGFVPASDPNSDYYDEVKSVAKDLDAIYATTYINEEYDNEAKTMLFDTFQFGLGIIKTVWDNSADGGWGNAVWRRCDPWTIYTDPYARNFRDMNFIIEAKRVSYEELERMYPNTYHLVKYNASSTDGYDERPTFYDNDQSPKAPFLGALPHGTALWNKRVSGGRTYEPLPGYVCYEYWLKENTDVEEIGVEGPDQNAYKQPKWRCIVVCNGEILFNEWAEDLWQHGQHPYEDYRFDDIGEMYGIALIDHLAYPQIYINRLLTALQQNAELIGNPIFLEPTNSGLSRIGIINRPGQRLPVSATSSAASNLPRWLDPPSMPQQVIDLVKFWIDRIENTGGLTGLQKGQAPNQRNSSGVINSVQDAAFVRIRSALSNLQWTYRRASLKAADLITQNYTDKRVKAILGPDGESTAIALRSHHFFDPGDDYSTPLRFILQVETGANRATSRQARMADDEKLFALGLVDDQYVLESRGVKDVKPILARLYQKRMSGVLSSPGQRQKENRSK